jgi:hypothetical protein
MRRHGIRTRSLMIGVAVIALILAGAERLAVMKVTADRYRGAPGFHTRRAQVAERSLRQLDLDEKLKDWVTRLVQFNRAMERRYREAARRPWSRVPRDPEPLRMPELF